MRSRGSGIEGLAGWPGGENRSLRVAHRTRTLLHLSLLGACSLPVFAQMSPQFASVLRNDGEQSAVIAGAKLSSVILENPCVDGRFIIANRVVIVAAPVFDEAGRLRSGQWKQTVDYSGCGMTRSLNVLISVPDGQRPGTRPLLPGTTRADPLLQVDAFRSPGLQAWIDSWRDPACTMSYVADTVFENEEAQVRPGARAPAWHETWTIAACNRHETTAVVFAPDATGTSFSFQLKPVNQEAHPGSTDHP